MRLDPDQLEWIVREVVRRLRDQSLRSPLLGGEGLGERGRADQASSSQGSDLKLADGLITLAQLDGQLHGVARLHVAHRAVVTPAVRDLLKERGIELVRGSKA